MNTKLDTWRRIYVMPKIVVIGRLCYCLIISIVVVIVTGNIVPSVVILQVIICWDRHSH
jgi:hypothetical protein